MKAILIVLLIVTDMFFSSCLSVEPVTRSSYEFRPGHGYVWVYEWSIRLK